MKRIPIIPEQTWLHAPTTDDLKRQVRRWKSLALAALVFAAGIGIAFLITCNLR